MELRLVAERHVGPIADRPHALGEAERGEAVEAVVRDSAALVAANSDAAGLTYGLAANLATARRAP